MQSVMIRVIRGRYSLQMYESKRLFVITVLYREDIYPLRKAWERVCGGGDVLLCHERAIYIIYRVAATLRIFNGTDSVVVIESVGG